MSDIPPFPLPHYNFPIDRIRHWMALKEDGEIFTSSEIVQGCGDSTHNAVYRLADKGELIREDGGFKKGRIMTIWDSWEEDVARENARMNRLLDAFTPVLENAKKDEREAIKEIVNAERSMHVFTKSEIGIAVCDSILATIEAERE